MKAHVALAVAMVAAAVSGCSTVVHAAPSPALPSAAPRAGGPESGPIDPISQAAPPRIRPTTPVQRAPLPAAEPEVPLPEIELSPQILFQLIAADLAAQRGEMGPAWSTYMNLARQTRDPRIARRAAEIAIGARALDEAAQSAQLWRELAPASRAAPQMLETLWLSTGRLKDAEPMLAERLARARTEGTLPAAYPQLARTLARVQDRAAAWQLVQRLSAPDEGVAAARLVRSQFSFAAGDFAVAATEAREAMRLAPDDEEAAVAAARALHRQPETKAEAIAILERFVQRSPMALEARYQLARTFAADGRLDDARLQLERAVAQAPDNPAVLFSLAQISHQAKQPAEASAWLQRYVELPRSVPRDNAPALLFLAQIAEEGGRTAEAIDWLSKVPRGEEFVPATVRRALLMGKGGQVEAGRALLQDAPASTVRERAMLVSGEAQLLREASRYQEAFDVLAGALERTPDNTELLYDHAMAAEKIDRLPVMETSLRRLIELRPDHAHAYNALGYTFADRSIRLDEARTLIEKALSLSPDDPHIMDSMGWVLFRQKDYPRALDYLRRAYAIRPRPTSRPTSARCCGRWDAPTRRAGCGARPRSASPRTARCARRWRG
jgi:tetratricopeptide (TPR) repeat protein